MPTDPIAMFCREARYGRFPNRSGNVFVRMQKRENGCCRSLFDEPDIGSVLSVGSAVAAAIGRRAVARRTVAAVTVVVRVLVVAFRVVYVTLHGFAASRRAFRRVTAVGRAVAGRVFAPAAVGRVVFVPTFVARTFIAAVGRVAAARTRIVFGVLVVALRIVAAAAALRFLIAIRGRVVV